MAEPGDQVVVFAWTNRRTEATAYNPRNKSNGQIPADVLEKWRSEPFTDAKLYRTTKIEINNQFIDPVDWKRGGNIRIWDKTDKPPYCCEGFGFNLASGKIGRFRTQSAGLLPID